MFFCFCFLKLMSENFPFTTSCLGALTKMSDVSYNGISFLLVIYRLVLNPEN